MEEVTRKKQAENEVRLMMKEVSHFFCVGFLVRIIVAAEIYNMNLQLDARN